MTGHEQGTVNIQGKDSQDALFIYFFLINRKRLRNILTGIQNCKHHPKSNS